MSAPRVAPVTAADAFPLRTDILRPGLPVERSRYPQDEDPETLHLGAFFGDRLVCVASLLPEDQDGGRTPGHHRLRGMVTVPDVRGRGVGSLVLGEGIGRLRARGARLLWCNGRTSATAFYERLGFAHVGAEFETPGTGPHHRFVLHFGG